MLFQVVTIFPRMFESYFNQSILKKALDSEIIRFNIIDLRNYADSPHKVTDDYPYGGDPGMVMKPEPLFKCIKNLKTSCQEKSLVVYLTPDGRLFNQNIAKELSQHKNLILICGRYKGIDERVRESLVDEEISIGDYVVTGGELAAMVVIDTVSRMIPEVLGCDGSAQTDSFYSGLLSYPIYTRPPVYEGKKVPEILLSGNHSEISCWQRYQALKRTYLRRPELLENAELSEKDKKYLDEIKEELSKNKQLIVD
ncbi:MAG: tRNA (guanosine(37)-N1)-methyltransferase TrmD [Candidatus Schekmanbacteria bacterium GWA2_38_11]|uniref:tRNA (guanine-N(1)-)-methyltransferase n=1 Tax=Candidatus Schekmanbacteria bacterium GWA2_38_11 TaxID=1817876 RepID=A0A1F7RNT0_9BACT|nr:MAG: tRNA (guanosine(37)-N1)-methyltransferase TrmD [Candidatus Schekmanbacteria bacterium GWA2_38_11]